MYTTVKQFNQYVLTLVEDVKAFNLTPTLFNSSLFNVIEEIKEGAIVIITIAKRSIERATIFCGVENCARIFEIYLNIYYILQML